MDVILAKKGMRSDRIWTHKVVYRSFLKYAPLFFDTWALLKSQYWPRNRLVNLREERLWLLFRDLQKIPYWREIVENTFNKVDITALSPGEALRRMPILTKQDLIRLGERAVDMAYFGKCDADQTSGSTGKPLHFLQDWGASLRSAAIVERTFRAATKSRYPIFYLRAKERYGFTFYRQVWFYASNYSSVSYRVADLQKLALRYASGLTLYGYTSWILAFAREMERSKSYVPLRYVMVAGEHLTEYDRSYLKRVTGADVFTLYAAREAGFLGFECEHHRMHINEEWAYVEIVDEGGVPLPEGDEGRVIVTAFDNRVMPFVRYDIGDRGSIEKGACPCGRTLRVLSFRGRTMELIKLTDDRTVSLLDIAYSIGSYKDAILDYQIVQEGAMSFLIKVVPGSQFEPKKEELEEFLIRLMHPRVQIRWQKVEEIPRAPSGKASYFARTFKRS